MNVRIIYCCFVLFAISVTGDVGAERVLNGDFPQRDTVLQFDTIVTLKPGSPAGEVVLFARSWVSSNFFEEAIIWAEPNGRALRLPVYPATLRIYSDSQAFEIGSDIRAEYCKSFAKPVQGSEVIHDMFGDYSIRNLRFADKRAQSARIKSTDIFGGNQLRRGGSNFVEVAVHEIAGTNLEGAATVNIDNGGNIDSLRITDKGQGLQKAIKYDYRKKDGAAELHLEHVDLPEYTISASLPGEGAKVRVRNETYQVKHLPVIYRKGGRTCTVEYQRIVFGKHTLSLPTRVEERDSKGQLLRMAVISNFREVNMTSQNAKKAGDDFAGLTQPYQDCRKVLTDYWRSTPDKVTLQDAHAIRSLRKALEEVSNPERLSMGEQLRRLNSLMDLNRVLGDEPALVASYQKYLSVLERNGLCGMVLRAGYSVVDASLVWGRNEEANLLLSEWLAAAWRSSSVTAVEDFAAAQMRAGNFWTAARLLEGVANWAGVSPNNAFDAEAMRAVALRELKTRLEKRAIDGAESAHLSWAASVVTPEELDVQQKTSENLARVLYSRLNELSSRENSLVAKLYGTNSLPMRISMPTKD